MARDLRGSAYRSRQTCHPSDPPTATGPSGCCSSGTQPSNSPLIPFVESTPSRVGQSCPNLFCRSASRCSKRIFTVIASAWETSLLPLHVQCGARPKFAPRTRPVMVVCFRSGSLSPRTVNLVSRERSVATYPLGSPGLLRPRSSLGESIAAPAASGWMRSRTPAGHPPPKLEDLGLEAREIIVARSLANHRRWLAAGDSLINCTNCLVS